LIASAAVGGGLIFIDQVTAPTHTLNPSLISIDSTPDDGKSPTEEDVGAALLRALKHQMIVEINTWEFGWTPNDKLGMQLWDNRVNRQLGVQQATVKMMEELQNITTLGDGDDPSQIILSALGRLNTDPYLWFDPGFAESGYFDGFNHIESFIELVRSHKLGSDGKPLAVFNVTQEDKRDIFDALNDTIGMANGRLIKSGSLFNKWFTADDDVYYAKGVAIVVRDILAVMRESYAQEFRERGFLVNIDEAISELNSIVEFQPAVALTSESDSMIPDHRAKLTQQLTFVSGRFQNALKSYGK
jgi:hypothetical protein